MKKLFFLLLLISSFSALAQKEPPYWKEIQAFKKADSIAPPPKKSILFVGSSSFRGWRDVQEYFPKKRIINRGFGGSSLPHLSLYANDIIFLYAPKQIVIYCGENDLAESDTLTAQGVLFRFQNLFALIRSRLPKTPIAFVSIKPSPSRQKLMPKIEAANALIKIFLQTQKRTAFIDVYKPMVDSTGLPKEELFLGDKLHMNAKGYAIWQQAIAPHLVKTKRPVRTQKLMFVLWYLHSKLLV